MKRKILIATTNAGKLLEYGEILKDLDLELVSLKDLGIEAGVEEDQPTFEGNALKKVNFYSALSDLPTLAEDSGLEIDYLGGEPGVLSRRWPGYEASDEELMSMALEKLRNAPWEKRGAQLRAILAFKPAENKDIAISEGILRGYITEKKAAEIIPGYPFRSIFYVPEIGKVLGELSMEEEARIAHRRQAILKIKKNLESF